MRASACLTVAAAAGAAAVMAFAARSPDPAAAARPPRERPSAPAPTPEHLPSRAAAERPATTLTFPTADEWERGREPERVGVVYLADADFGGRRAVGDADLAHVARYRNLRTLVVHSEAVTDAAADGIARARGLEAVVLYGRGVTDAGAARLAGLPNLRTLGFFGTRVTPEAAARLARERPGLTVAVWPPWVEGSEAVFDSNGCLAPAFIRKHVARGGAGVAPVPDAARPTGM